jgi:hypothetical protein
MTIMKSISNLPTLYPTKISNNQFKKDTLVKYNKIMAKTFN